MVNATLKLIFIKTTLTKKKTAHLKLRIETELYNYSIITYMSDHYINIKFNDNP